MNKNEFKYLGQTIENISISYGILLVIWAALISWISGSGSVTSWIPAFLGFPIFIFGCLARIKPDRQKLYMHFAVLFGLLTFLAGLDFIRAIGSESGAFTNFYAGSSKLMLLSSGALFCYLCIKSFRFARRSKSEIEAVKTTS
jgi:hypothetical protein